MEIVVTYENPNSEDSIQDNIVAEPIGEYKPTEKPPYAGTSINRAIKDYYACQTNREKVSVLQWIVENPEFQVLKRYSTAETAVYGLNISQYDDILLSGEMPKNLAIAQKLVMNNIYRAMLGAEASEQSERMIAMDNATRNAEDMSRKLTLKYNTLRQSAITTELTEIISGAEAI